MCWSCSAAKRADCEERPTANVNARFSDLHSPAAQVAPAACMSQSPGAIYSVPHSPSCQLSFDICRSGLLNIVC
jgi:hypothetical protein